MQILYNWQVMINVVIYIPKLVFMNHETETFIGLVSVGQSAVKSTFLASAIRKCGGNEDKGNLLYTAYGSAGQVHNATHVEVRSYAF